jgi:DNA-binding MarR family transcriptional regulator
MLTKDYTAKLLNLEDVIITNVENISEEVHVSLELPRMKHRCRLDMRRIWIIIVAPTTMYVQRSCGTAPARPALPLSALPGCHTVTGRTAFRRWAGPECGQSGGFRAAMPEPFSHFGGFFMDTTNRNITKIAREAEKLVLLTLRDEGVGTAEIDLIHALRHNPGCTQARLGEILHADKAAVARRTKNLEAKGYLTRVDDPHDRRSQLLFPTEKAEAMKASKAEIEGAFYEYLLSALTEAEASAFTAALQKLYVCSKAESRAGFPHFTGKQNRKEQP